MAPNRSAHTRAKKSAAIAPLRADGGIPSCPSEDILAVVRALAKRAAHEDHAREAAQNHAVGEFS